MHPYHSYIVLMDKEMNSSISRILSQRLEGAKKHLTCILEGLEKRKSSPLAEIELRVAKELMTEAENDYNMWFFKKTRQINQDQIPELFRD